MSTTQEAFELSPRARQIARIARRILERDGIDALTMRRVAERMKIRAPSLYKHFPDKAALETAIIASGLEEFARELEQEERKPRPLESLAKAYREFAKAHPHLYRLMTQRPLPRNELPPGLEDRAAGPIIRTAGSRDRARAAWAFAHGMVMLELNGRFPPDADLDAAWMAGVKAFASPS